MPLDYHAILLADETRTRAFLSALDETVRPGMRVLDIGTGSGILAMHAAQLGAEVVAIEMGEVIDYARATAESNGLKIDFRRSNFLEMSDKELGTYNVIVSETIGNVMLDEQIVRIMAKARTLLREGGVLIPRQLTGYAALCWSEVVRRAVEFWDGERYGIDFKIIRSFMENRYHFDYRQGAKILGPRVPLYSIDLMTAKPSSYRGSGNLIADRNGVCNAVLLWWDADLTGTVMLDLGPGTKWKKQSWYRTLLPVGPIKVAEGESRAFLISYDDRLPTGNVSWSLDGETRSAIFSAPLTEQRRNFLFGKDL